MNARMNTIAKNRDITKSIRRILGQISLDALSAKKHWTSTIQ